MGTDIHLSAEVARYDGNGNQIGWDWLPCPVIDAEHRRGEWYSNRNYLVFAMLADVRNGYGFAGTPTHSPIVPISEPRGVPDDITAETLAILSEEHSASWMMLNEILDYDWSQPIEREGTVIAATDRTSEFVERMKMLAAAAGERPTRVVFDFDS